MTLYQYTSGDRRGWDRLQWEPLLENHKRKSTQEKRGEQEIMCYYTVGKHVASNNIGKQTHDLNSLFWTKGISAK